MDIVIPLSCESKYDNDELRIALRSIERNLKGYGRIWLVTDFAPKWIRGVNIILCPDKHASNKDANLFDKLLLACNNPLVSDDFLFWSDDQVILELKHVKAIPVTSNSKTKVHCANGNKWQKRMYNTFMLLESFGKPLNCNFESHMPQPWNKAKALEVLSGVDYVSQPGHCINTLYYGLSGVTSGVDQESLKVSVETLDIVKLNKAFLGYNDTGFSTYLRKKLFELFPEPSKYELPAEPKLIITPTGDREQQFNTVIDCVSRQTVKPDSWIIVDDGKVPMLQATLDRMPVPYTYIRATPKEYNSLAENAKTLLSMSCGKVVIFEDDDHYQSGYMKECIEKLNEYDLVGPAARVAYSLTGKCYRSYSNSEFSTLHSTAFTGKAAKELLSIVGSMKQGSFSVDTAMWQGYKGKKATVNYENVPVSLKGWPCGRGGCTKYHRATGDNFIDDSALTWLHQQVGTQYDGFTGGKEEPIVTQPIVTQPNRVLDAFKTCKTDKDTKHSYGQFYTELFKDMLNLQVSLCEIGVSSGSLEAWRKIFPNSVILGLDTKKAETNEEMIVCDATVADSRITSRRYDIIIEDASHKVEDQIKHAKLFMPLLNPGGYYIIEDIASADNARLLKRTFPELVVHDRRGIKGRWDDIIAVWRKK